MAGGNITVALALGLGLLCGGLGAALLYRGAKARARAEGAARGYTAGRIYERRRANASKRGPR